VTRALFRLLLLIVATYLVALLWDTDLRFFYEAFR
jgi:hypothetical protein